jgi:hypothetical protein
MKYSSFTLEDINEEQRLLMSPGRFDSVRRSPLLSGRFGMFDMSEMSLQSEVHYEPSFELNWEDTDQKICSLEESSSQFNDTIETSTSIITPKLCKEILESKKLPDFIRKELAGVITKAIMHTKAKFFIIRGTVPTLAQNNTRSFNYSLGFFNTGRTENNEEEKYLWKSAEQGAEICNCPKSKCLKLYCKCFASDKFCKGCKCIDCHNTKFHEPEILEAKNAIREKSPVRLKRHCIEKNEKVSCACSKSECSKKYCECLRKGKRCGIDCTCKNCRNQNALRAFTRYKHPLKKQKIE